ncbi:hypothetical protein, partial [Thermus scotoductus]|uniref:hypothetical protein n=1 Tax=Thermus scotoductus TaxID=37636 RepID=UPI001C12CC80
GLPFPSLLPSRSSGGYPDPWGTSSPVGTPIHTHTLTHNSLHDPRHTLTGGNRTASMPDEHPHKRYRYGVIPAG